MSAHQQPLSGRASRDVTVSQRFLVTLALIALLSNVLVNILTLFTDTLRGFAVGPLTWAYILGVGQFVIAIVIGHIYLRVANRSDAAAAARAGS